MNPSFDFRQEARDILDRFPALRPNTIFVSTEDEELRVKQDRRLKTVAAYPLCVRDVFNAATQKKLKACIDDAHERNTSLAFGYHQANKAENNVIVFNHDDPLFDCLGSKAAPLLKKIIMRHEAGHLLVPGALPLFNSSGSSLFTETAPDAFAALRTMQETPEGEDVIRMFSWRRAYSFVQRGIVTHITTSVLDEIVNQTAYAELQAAGPETLIKKAHDFASRYTPKHEEMLRAKAAFAPFRNKFGNPDTLNFKMIKNLATTTLATSHRYTFLIGSRLIQPFLDGVPVICKGQTFTLPPQMGDYYRRQFLMKANDMRDQNSIRLFLPKETGGDKKTPPASSFTLRI